MIVYLINRVLFEKLRPVVVSPVDYYIPVFQDFLNAIPAYVQGFFFLILLVYLVPLLESLRSCPSQFSRTFHFKLVYNIGIVWFLTVLMLIWRSEFSYRVGLWWRMVKYNSAEAVSTLPQIIEVIDAARVRGTNSAFLDHSLTFWLHWNTANVWVNWQGLWSLTGKASSSVTSLLYFADWVSFWLVLLVILSIFICAVSAYERGVRLRYFSMALIWIGICMIIAFVTTNMLVFYCAFEGVLIPTFFLVGVFGSSPSRVPAAMRLFLFTVVGSVFFLLATVVLYNFTGTFNFWELYDFCASNPQMQLFIFPLVFFGLAFKVPFFPVYLWLTSAHVEAPTAGSMILASLMLKLGIYGLLRFGFQLCPLGVEYWNSLSVVLPLLGFTFISYLTYVINDLKRLVAYTSVSHMNFLVIALVSTGSLGFGAAVYTMISHAIISSALFFLIGCLYRRGESRSVLLFSGLAQTSPRLFFFFSLFLFANAGLPLFAAFPGEFFALLSLWQYEPALILLVLPGFFFIIFGMVRVIGMGCGTAVIPTNGFSYLVDLSALEVAVVTLLMVWQVWLALCPYAVVNTVFIF